MEQFQISLLKHLSSITPQQLSQLTPAQINQLRDLTLNSQLQQLVAKQQQIQNKNQQSSQTSQQNNSTATNANLQTLQLQQQQELARIQAAQQLVQQQQQAQLQLQLNQQLTPQQLVQQQLSQNVNFASSFPPTLVPPQNQANLFAYGYVQTPISSNANGKVNTEVKYKQLLAVIEEMSKDIKPLYSGSKTSAERFKRLIQQAKLLIKECQNDLNTNNAR